jgi:hypothetical protein
MIVSHAVKVENSRNPELLHTVEILLKILLLGGCESITCSRLGNWKF